MVLPNLAAINLPLSDVCGAGSLLEGTGFLKLTGGNLAAGGSCDIEVDLMVPANTALGVFTNTTSSLFQNGLVVGTPATAELTVGGTIGGNVSGLVGSGLVLQNNKANNLSITKDGKFVFSNILPDGSSYFVTVFTQPTKPAQICSIENGDGKVSGASVSDVMVTCVDNEGVFADGFEE